MQLLIKGVAMMSPWKRPWTKKKLPAKHIKHTNTPFWCGTSWERNQVMASLCVSDHFAHVPPQDIYSDAALQRLPWRLREAY